MRRLFTSESVTEGHPDKLCDYISDSVLDEYLKQDKNSRVACETVASKGLILVTGEITSKGEVDIEKVVRNIAKNYDVTVATSDILEQVIITGEGARKISAIDFKKEIEVIRQNIQDNHLRAKDVGKTYLFDTLPQDKLMFLEEIRLGRKKWK